MPDVDKIITAVNALGLLVLGFMQYANSRRQVQSQTQVGEADATEKITNSATDLIEQLRNELIALRPLVPRVSQLENELSNLRKANDRLINWAERLVRQIEQAGLEPVPFRIDAESDRMKTLPVEKKIK